jgi:hypothetical protein
VFCVSIFLKIEDCEGEVVLHAGLSYFLVNTVHPLIIRYSKLAENLSVEILKSLDISFQAVLYNIHYNMRI